MAVFAQKIFLPSENLQIHRQKIAFKGKVG